MITAVLIDDDKHLRTGLKALLDRYTNEIHIIGEAESVKTGVALLEQLKPQVIFLDIHLSDGTGFDILEKYGHDLTYWQSEAFQAIHTTMCLNLVDFYSRRVPLVLAYKDHGIGVLSEVSFVFQQELNWTDAETKNQQKLVQDYIDSELSWRKSLS